ncbi:MAG TPA: WD40 repeat domain-containing protein [Candidatus Solibacter sp.]|nr:WD40 repeat domain-containing protein [Candidatus Solibacter sp.]
MSPRSLRLMLLCVLSTIFSSSLPLAQERTRPKTAAPATGLARVCDDPYNGEELKTGWPQPPAYVLFKRANSKVWGPNLRVKLPGMQAATPATAHTLVCVEEHRLEMGNYESGAKAYTPSWDVYLLRLPDRAIYFQKGGIFGGDAPFIKWHPGAGVGSQPVSQLQEWLRLVLKSDVARLKLSLPFTSADKVRQMAFSGDGTRLVVAREPYHYSTPQPDLKKYPLVTVFDVASGQPVADIPVEDEPSAVAIAENGELVATEHYGHPQIWNVSSRSIVQKISADGVRSLAFGADGNLGIGMKERVAVFNPGTGTELFSSPGSRISYGDGHWIAISGDGKTTYEVRSAQPIAHFAATDKEVVASVDGRSELTRSVLSAQVRWAGKESEYVDMPSIGNEGTGRVSAIASSPSGFVVGGNDGIVALLSSGSNSRLFATDHSQIESLAVSRDGKQLAVGDSSGKVSLWELQ